MSARADAVKIIRGVRAITSEDAPEGGTLVVHLLHDTDGVVYGVDHQRCTIGGAAPTESQRAAISALLPYLTALRSNGGNVDRALHALNDRELVATGEAFRSLLVPSFEVETRHEPRAT
jgi:hypothetical protein